MQRKYIAPNQAFLLRVYGYHVFLWSMRYPISRIRVSISTSRTFSLWSGVTFGSLTPMAMKVSSRILSRLSWLLHATCQSFPDGTPGNKCWVCLSISSNLKSAPWLVSFLPDVFIDHTLCTWLETSSGILANMMLSANYSCLYNGCMRPDHNFVNFARPAKMAEG